MDQFDEKRKELEERKNNIISSMSYKQKEIETLLIESRDRKDHLYKLRFKMPDDSWIIIHFILSICNYFWNQVRDFNANDKY